MRLVVGTLIIGIILPFATFGQTNRMIVRDCLFPDQALVGVVVKTMDNRFGWVSDSSGIVFIPQEMIGKLLVVQFPAYVTDTLYYQSESSFCLSAISGKEVLIEENAAGKRINISNPQVFEQINARELRKAACCNLSESFETSASVDASYSDGVSGLRQIRLLGLDGKYVPVTVDNVPYVRGVGYARASGLLPGPWIQDISLAKGMGSVMNGFESISGLMNIQTKAKGIQLNQFANSMGRAESNLVFNSKISRSWHMTFLGHVASQRIEPDMNKDNFADVPKSSGKALRIQLKHEGPADPWRADFAFSYVGQQSNGGYLGKDQYWRYFEKFESLGASGKLGYVFKGSRNRSLGSQFWNWNTVFQPTLMSRSILSQGVITGANILYASDINQHIRFVVGISFTYDRVRESLGALEYSRQEKRVGSFAEYTFGSESKWLVNAGLRVDKSSCFGWIVSPRLHGRYTMNSKNTFKFSFGQGNRAANILSDQTSLFASNRILSISLPSAPQIESAWGTGIGWIYKSKLLYRPLTFQVDGNITYFTSQIVYDQERPGALSIYQQNGNGRSIVAQIQADWSPAKRVDISIAFRKMQVESGFWQGLKPSLLTPLSRGLLTISWSSRTFREHWVIGADAVLKSTGLQRVALESAEKSCEEYSRRFQTINLQVALRYKARFEIYTGAENVTNYMIHNAIRYGNYATSSYFDASQIWGPVMGRLLYLGLRLDWK